MSESSLDKADLCLLNALQEDADQSVEVLAERCNMSASTVQRRVRALRKGRKIERTVAVLHPGATGRLTTFFALVETDRESPHDRDALRRWCREEAQVQQAYYVTGTTDLLLIVLAADVEAYDKLMQAMQEANPSIRRVTTNVVIDAFKRGLTLPIGIE